MGGLGRVELRDERTCQAYHAFGRSVEVLSIHESGMQLRTQEGERKFECVGKDNCKDTDRCGLFDWKYMCVCQRQCCGFVDGFRFKNWGSWN